MSPPTYPDGSPGGSIPRAHGFSDTPGLDKVDSPLDSRHAVPLMASLAPYPDSDLNLTIRQGRGMPRGMPSQSADCRESFRFVVVDHPDKLRNQEEMRKIRKHVMMDYFEKERQKPLSNDIRVRNPGQSRKRKRTEEAPPGTSVNMAAPFCIFRPEQEYPTSMPSVISTISSDSHSNQVLGSAGGWNIPHSYEIGQQLQVCRTTVRRADEGEPKCPPLVPGISGGFRNYDYLGTAVHEVPFEINRIGRELNPFDTWPKFSNPHINVSQLKWSCSRRFGSRGISDHWVPTLLKARHAFLSTICISSAHDDIMKRAFTPPNERPKHESIERMQVRYEVTSMINESMRDPQMRTADATIVAVLQLLNAEIMGCDDNVMHIHQNGLHAMICRRGGLTELGVNGQLAVITTMTMYIIAALRETLPHSDFIHYAEKQDARMPTSVAALPESPLYSRPEGYLSLTKILPRHSRIFGILDADRTLARAFAAQYAEPSNKNTGLSRRGNTNTAHNAEDIGSLATRIFAFHSCAESDFETMPERYTYEAIRVASRIFAHGLANRIPFSEAAAQLQDSAPCSFPMHVHVRDALLKTDTTDCWGHLAGVLFWISLVVGAAANPAAASEGHLARQTTSDEEDARKFLAAIAVRCSILLGFSFAPSIIATMKRMIGIQQVLRKGKDSPGPTGDPPGVTGVRHCYGPPTPRRAIAQKGFVDFAQDFLNS